MKDVGYAKGNKRCIPKDGMPHAYKACQNKKRNRKGKRKKRYIPICHMPTRHVKKKRDSPCPRKKYTRREMGHAKEFINHPSKIPIHLDILIRLYDLFLLGSCF